MAVSEKKYEMDLKEVGNFCKKFRKDYLRITQKELSRITGLEPRTISAFESGSSRNLEHLYNYYYLADEEQKKVFINNIFEIGYELEL